MTLFAETVSKAQTHFPNLSIAYKDKSILMKLLSKVLFFNKNFMNYTTTLGSTIYFSSEEKIRIAPVTETVILLHEISHIYNNNKTNDLLFKFKYLFPQILALLAIPAFFLFGWKLAFLCLLFLAPIPAYFRMMEEKQAYIMSLYAMNQLNLKYGFGIDLLEHKNVFVADFSGSEYFWMWPFPGIKADFDQAVIDIQAGIKTAYSQELYGIMDDILMG